MLRKGADTKIKNRFDKTALDFGEWIRENWGEGNKEIISLKATEEGQKEIIEALKKHHKWV